MKPRMAAKSGSDVQGGEGEPGGAEDEAGVVGEVQGGLHVPARVALVEALEEGVVDGFEGGGDPGDAEAGQVAGGLGVLEEMLDLDGDVVAEGRVAATEHAQQLAAVGEGVEEVGVAEGDVLGAEFDLGVDVGQNEFGRDEAQAAGRRWGVRGQWRQRWAQPRLAST